MLLCDLQIFRNNRINHKLFLSANVDESVKSKHEVQGLLYSNKIREVVGLYFSDFISRSLFEFFYCLQFIFFARKFDLWISYMNSSILTIFRPSTTISFFHDKPKLFQFRLFKSRYKRGRYIFCSQFLRNNFLLKYKIPKSRTTVLYNSVDKKSFFVKKTSDNKVVTFLYAGAWTEDKGLELLANAIKAIPRKRKNFKVLLAGSTDLWRIGFSKGYKAHFKNKIIKLINKDERVEILGEINHSEMNDLYNLADFLLLPSLCQESASLVVAESSLCGVPSIIFDSGGAVEMQSGSEYDKVVRPSSAEALSLAIQEKIGKTLLKKERSLVRKKVIRNKKFSPVQREKKLLQIINDS